MDASKLNIFPINNYISVSVFVCVCVHYIQLIRNSFTSLSSPERFPTRTRICIRVKYTKMTNPGEI